MSGALLSLAHGPADARQAFLEDYALWSAEVPSVRSDLLPALLSRWDLPDRECLTQTYRIARRTQESKKRGGEDRTPMMGLRNTDSDYPILDQFERLEGDWGVTSDWHMPLHSQRYLLLYKAMCRVFEIRQHVAVGDVFNQSSLSFHGHEPGDVFADELEHVRDGLTFLLEDAETFLWTLGNHDDLVMRRTEGQITPHMLLAMVTQDKRARISPYYHCEINDTYRLTHAKAFSKIRGRVAYDLCAKFRKSVVMAHQHGIGMVPDVTGKDVAIDLGGLFDPGKFGYTQMRDTLHPVWTPGFLLIKDNSPFLFSDHLKTNWEYYLGRAALTAINERLEEIAAQ